MRPRVRRTRLAGQRVVVISAPARDEVPKDARLTPAEAEVAALVRAGASDKEIAARRGTSVRTVHHQVGAVLRKLGLGSRLELMAR